MKYKYKRKHFITKTHTDLSESIVNRYCVKDPKVDEIKKLLRNYVKAYSKKFTFFYTTCKWNLQFSNCNTVFISANTEYRRHFLLGCDPYSLLEMYLMR